MVQHFTSTIMEIISTFIPNKIVKFDDRDPPWITPAIKTAIKRKHRVYKKFAKRGHIPDEWEHVKQIRNETSGMITAAKENYFSSLGRKLSDPSICVKAYWTTLNKVINNKKMTNIPPLLENGIFVTNFQKKADIFNDFFCPAMLFESQ